MTVVSWDPRIFHYRRFLSDGESAGGACQMVSQQLLTHCCSAHQRVSNNPSQLTHGRQQISWGKEGMGEEWRVTRLVPDAFQLDYIVGSDVPPTA
jgi:hypothetical protein